MKRAQEANNDMITLARESRGLSQKELSVSLNIPQGRLSKIENGMLDVNEEILENLSTVLQYPREFFFQSERVYDNTFYFFRKNKTLPKKRLNVIDAQLNVMRIAIQKVLKMVDINTDIPSLDVDEYGTPENIAKTLRHYWKIPKGKIDNVTKILENKGIPIMFCDFGTRLFSGVTVYTDFGHPIIFINSNMPGDRQRFTLCHELAHIVMHKLPSPEMDEEADRFASEFLMPEADISHQLTRLKLDRLALLKREWKVSMQSLIIRADRLKKINRNQKEYLWKLMSVRGYRTQEPPELDIPQEQPNLLKEIFHVIMNELNFSVDEVLNFIYYQKDEFVHKYGQYLKMENKLQIV